MQEEVKDTLEPRSEAGLGAQASWGAELQISQVHLKGSSPVKMTTEKLPCCSSPGAFKGPSDKTITRKITSLKISSYQALLSFDIWFFLPPPPAPFLPHQTQ